MLTVIGVDAPTATAVFPFRRRTYAVSPTGPLGPNPTKKSTSLPVRIKYTEFDSLSTRAVLAVTWVTTSSRGIFRGHQSRSFVPDGKEPTLYG